MSKENKTVQDKIKNLETITSWFSSDDFKIEQAIDKYKQAESLAKEIEDDLNSLKNEISVIKQKFSN